MSTLGKRGTKQGSGRVFDSVEVQHTLRRIAYEHGMTLEEAKIFYLRHQDG